MSKKVQTVDEKAAADMEEAVKAQMGEIESILLVSVCGMGHIGYSAELVALKCIEMGLGHLFSEYMEHQQDKMPLDEFVKTMKDRLTTAVDDLLNAVLVSKAEEERAAAGVTVN